MGPMEPRGPGCPGGPGTPGKPGLPFGPGEPGIEEHLVSSTPRQDKAPADRSPQALLAISLYSALWASTDTSTEVSPRQFKLNMIKTDFPIFPSFVNHQSLICSSRKLEKIFLESFLSLQSPYPTGDQFLLILPHLHLSFITDLFHTSTLNAVSTYGLKELIREGDQISPITALPETISYLRLYNQ